MEATRDVFVVGDVHGCLYTFIKLLEQWDPRSELLVQVGDLVDRGRFSPEVMRLAFELDCNFKNDVVFLKGNHELMMEDYLTDPELGKNWLQNGGNQTLYQFDVAHVNPDHYSNWINQLPLYWENEAIFVSHAGISGMANLQDPRSKDGLLWSRRKPINIGKLQIIGHTPGWDGVPKYYIESNAWNIDTCAYGGICLTAIRLTGDGQFKEFLSVPTDGRDT